MKERFTDNRIWLSAPHMSGDEQKYIREAFETNWVAPLGPNVNGFEEDLEKFLKTGHVVALSSGTAALHLALIMLGVEKGDEVICQSMTFSASANPITYQNATPVFVDSEPDTLNMSPEYLEIAIKDRLRKGKKVKAIIPVHLYGMPAKMDEILNIAHKYEIPVIEDAAEALGSHIQGKMCGTFGDMALISFNGNKIITTSGGGVLVAKEEYYTKRALFLATQARDEAPHYQHSEIGYNYRMSNILAGIGRGQMEVINERIGQRRHNFDYYKEALKSLPGISFFDEPEGFFSNRWLSTIMVDPDSSEGVTRRQISQSLALLNIDSRPLWKPMHMQPVFAKSPFYGNGISEDFFNRSLCLPSGSNLTDSDLDRVVEGISSLYKRGERFKRSLSEVPLDDYLK